MQTPKSTRPHSLEISQKSSFTTPRVVRKLRTPGSDFDSSPNPISKTPKDKSPKIVDRRSPRNLATEKKKPTKVSELEIHLSYLQDELKKAKGQLGLSESQRHKAELEAQETKKQLAAMSEILDETQNQLNELSESEDSRILELRKISQDRDRAWQSELEAVRTQHSIESSALASAMQDMQKLKSQLERVSESAHAEIQRLRVELTDTLDLVEKLKEQLSDSRENEARACEELIRAQIELRTKLIENEREIELEIELRTLELTLKDLNTILMEKESRIQSITKENERLKTEIDQEEIERSRVLTKLSSLTEEALKSSKKSEWVAEQLDASQATNSEMEAELRRLKVQSDQWRKAAEAAAAMLSIADKGKCLERTMSMDYRTIGRKLGSGNCDDDGDDDVESIKKRNGNVLRKIGVLLKKGQK